MPTYLRYPRIPTPYRFLNAGGSMGRAHGLIDLFEQITLRATEANLLLLLTLSVIGGAVSLL